MLLLIADENFNNDIVRGLLRQNPNLDIVRVQDVGLRGEEDPVILEWAANAHVLAEFKDLGVRVDNSDFSQKKVIIYSCQ